MGCRLIICDKCRMEKTEENVSRVFFKSQGVTGGVSICSSPNLVGCSLRLDRGFFECICFFISLDFVQVPRRCLFCGKEAI